MLNKETRWLFVKGMAMGAADVVPGVSGGTIALITGIYERLIEALSRVDVRRLWKTVEWKLFIPLGAGILTSIALFSNLVHIALTERPGETYAFFFGLIAVSAWLVSPLRPASRRGYAGQGKGRILGAMAAGAAFAYLFVGLNPLNGDHSFLTVFLSGMVAIMAMMLPGVSGSFLLLFLGQYEFVLGAVRGLVWPVLLVFSVGALAGMLIFSRVLQHLISRHRVITLSFLVGMMIGSLRLPYEEVVASGVSFMSVIGGAVLGFGLVLVIEQAAQRIRSRQ